MNIAITGGSGQLGTLVLRRLLDDRRVRRIVSIDVRPPLLVGSKLQPVRADVRDRDLSRYFAGCDAVIHLAYIVFRLIPRETFESINVDGSKNVFRAAADAGVPHIVYASSIAAYGVVPGHPQPIVEETPRVRQQDFPYAMCKFDVESFLDEFEREHPGLAVARMRPGILVGSRMDHPFGAVLKKRMLVESDAPAMPLVWDEDVADAFLLAVHTRAQGAFNLVASEPRSMADLGRETGMPVVRVPLGAMKVLAQASPLFAKARLMDAVDPAWVDAALAPMEISNDKARRDLRWSPRAPTCTDVLKNFDATAPRTIDARIVVFFRAVSLAARTVRPVEDLRAYEGELHVKVTGPRGGDYTIHVHDKRVHVSAGAPRPPSATITLSDQTLLALLAGRMDYSTAQLTGRIRVDGEPIVIAILGAMIRGVREGGTRPGIAGRTARLLTRWLESGGNSPVTTSSPPGRSA